MVVWYCVCAAPTPASDKWIHHNYSPSGPKTPGLAGSVMVQKQQARHVLMDALNIWYKVTSVPAQRPCLQSILIQRGGGIGEEMGKTDREGEWKSGKAPLAVSRSPGETFSTICFLIRSPSPKPGPIRAWTQPRQGLKQVIKTNKSHTNPLKSFRSSSASDYE